MENEKLLSYFNDYLEGRLDSEIRKEFINRLESDIEFYEEYRIKEGIKKIEMRKIVTELRHRTWGDYILEKESKKDTKRIKIEILNWIKKNQIQLLFSGLLLVSIIWVLSKSNNEQDFDKNQSIPEVKIIPNINNQNLQNENDTQNSINPSKEKEIKDNMIMANKTDENSLYDIAYLELSKYRYDDFSIDQYRGEKDIASASDNRKLGQFYFVNEDYKQAVSNYAKVSNIKEYPNDYLKYGYSLIMINEYDMAKKCFTGIVENDLANEWYDRAKWYLFLISVLNEKSGKRDFKTAFYEYYAGEKIDEEIKQRIINIK